MITQQDNTVVKSIALLTMTFLPATFISVRNYVAPFFLHLTHAITGVLQYDLLQFRRRWLGSLGATMGVLGGYYCLDASGSSYLESLAKWSYPPHFYISVVDEILWAKIPSEEKRKRSRRVTNGDLFSID